jgi:hypothetical protein
MRANEIGALPDALARQPHCLVVIVADKLGAGSGAAINSGPVRTQTQSALRGGSTSFQHPQ